MASCLLYYTTTHLVPLETVANSNVEHLDINIFLRTIGQPFIFVCQHTNTTSSVNTSKNSIYSKGTANHIVMVYTIKKTKQNKTNHNIHKNGNKNWLRIYICSCEFFGKLFYNIRYSLLRVLTYVCHHSS